MTTSQMAKQLYASKQFRIRSEGADFCRDNAPRLLMRTSSCTLCKRFLETLGAFLQHSDTDPPEGLDWGAEIILASILLLLLVALLVLDLFTGKLTLGFGV